MSPPARPEAQAHGSPQDTAQGKEGMPLPGKTSRHQDALARHGYHSRDGRFYDRQVQRKDLQPS